MSTLTVYPIAGTTGAVDSNMYVEHATYSTAHDAADADAEDSTDPELLGMNSDVGATYFIRRGGMLFDTSALGSGATISAAVLSLYYNSDKANADAGQAEPHIVDFNPASLTDIVVGDWDQFGTTSFATVAYSGISTAQYYNFTLDSNGIANISKTGTSAFGIRSAGDINNSTPTGGNRVSWMSADTAGTSNDPKLVITYTAVVGPANLKTYNTNTVANIKSINTNLIANIKSLNTNV